MSQLHFISKRRPGKHLSYSDRQLIEYVHWNNLKKPQRERKSQKELAAELGISPATLSRELRRGYVLQQRSDLTEYYRYSAEVAQCDYDLKASRKGPDLKIGHDHELAQTLETSILSKEPRTTIYYAHPYSSWERGSNENLNGFIRYYIPKGTPLKQFTRSDLRELQDYINEYPNMLGICFTLTCTPQI